MSHREYEKGGGERRDSAKQEFREDREKRDGVERWRAHAKRDRLTKGGATGPDP